MKHIPASLPITNVFVSFARRGFLVLLPAILALVIYSQTIGFDFVTYDDYELVYQNGTFLSHLSNVVESFRTHAFTTHRAESAYYRPLLLVSYIFDYQCWGLSPAGYHCTNLLLHLFVTVLVFFLVERLARESIVAAVASTLFAIHPIQTETVSWVAGRNDLLLALFIVLMIYCYVRYRENPPAHRYYFVAAMIAFACALCTKESAAFYIFLFPAYHFCCEDMAGRESFDRRSLRDFILIGIILILYLGMRRHVIGDVIGAERLYGGGTTIMERVRQIPALLAAHCAMLVVPVQLSVVHPIDRLLWLRAPWSWLALTIPILIGALLWWSWRHDRVMWFGAAWTTVGLIPTLGLFPVAVPILEHRLYVPMVGFVIVLGRIVVRLMRHRESLSKKRFTVARAGIGILTLLCAALSFIRVPVWKNSETLWKDAIAKAPTYSRSYFNLAGWYFERRQYLRTAELLEEYLPLVPNDPTAYSKLRQSYFLAGRYQDAARVCRTMIALAPTNIDRYAEAAELYMQMDLADSAIGIYTSGIERNPAAYQLCDLLGRVYARTARMKEAEYWYRRAIGVSPGFAQAHFDLGVLCASMERSTEALAHIEEGLHFGNPDPLVARLLYQIYVDAGMTGQADSVRRRFNLTSKP